MSDNEGQNPNGGGEDPKGEPITIRVRDQVRYATQHISMISTGSV